MSEQLNLDLSSSAEDDALDADDVADLHLPFPSVLEEEAGESPDNRPQQFASSVGKMTKMMTGDGALDNGAIAELRRISPQKPYTPSLWRLLLDLKESEPWGGLDRDVYERRMATLAMSMAICVGFHKYDVPLGRALAKAGWSELRFVRLMEARGETLETFVRRVSQFLASKSQPANWVDVGWLLLGQDWKTAQKTRLRISRSYYGTLHAQKQDQSA